MAIYAKNTKQAADTWCGQEIQPGSYYGILASELVVWGQNDKVITDVGSGDLVIALSDDGTTDISSPNQALNRLRKENPTDSDGAPITKEKIVPEGWSYQLRGFDVDIGVWACVTSLDAYGAAKSDYVVTHYDINGDQVTDPLLVSTVTKTYIDIEPTHDYAIVGGIVFQDTSPVVDCRIGVVGAPYIPKVNGGTVEFGQGINLRYVDKTGNVSMDGRNPKILSYDVTYHTSMLRVVLNRPAATAHTFHLLLEMFNPPGV